MSLFCWTTSREVAGLLNSSSNVTYADWCKVSTSGIRTGHFSVWHPYQISRLIFVSNPTTTFPFIIPNTKQLPNFSQSVSEPVLLKGHVSWEGQRVSREWNDCLTLLHPSLFTQNAQRLPANCELLYNCPAALKSSEKEMVVEGSAESYCKLRGKVGVKLNGGQRSGLLV